VSLHGHIHESRAAARIGGTLALNPGSDYHGGMLLGVLVTVARDAVHHRFTAG
jgi:Icc-related predicted phosphoesterase